jgi:hypothetical protein
MMPASLTFAVVSGATQQVDDKSDYENCAEYAAAEVHVGLLMFLQQFNLTMSLAARLGGDVHTRDSVVRTSDTGTV